MSKKNVKAKISISIPAEDSQGNQIDLIAYKDNWKSEFKKHYGESFSLSYSFDDGTGADKIENEYQLEEKGIDVDEIRYAMQNAHSVAFCDETSYREDTE